MAKQIAYLNLKHNFLWFSVIFIFSDFLNQAYLKLKTALMLSYYFRLQLACKLSKKILSWNQPNNLKSAIIAIFRKGWDGRTLLVRASKTHYSIWKIIFVLGINKYVERPEGKIRRCLFFYVKTF